MGCNTITMPDGGVAIVCNRSRRPKACSVCGRGRVTKLCDATIRVRQPRKSKSKTCDRGLCDRCAVSKARPAQLALDGSATKADTYDLCPEHARQP